MLISRPRWSSLILSKKHKENCHRLIRIQWDRLTWIPSIYHTFTHQLEKFWPHKTMQIWMFLGVRSIFCPSFDQCSFLSELVWNQWTALLEATTHSPMFYSKATISFWACMSVASPSMVFACIPPRFVEIGENTRVPTILFYWMSSWTAKQQTHNHTKTIEMNRWNFHPSDPLKLTALPSALRSYQRVSELGLSTSVAWCV